MIKASFRPHERLNDPKDFKRAFDQRKSVSDDALIVHAFANGLDFARLGISVGKKKVRKATDRNRVKRLLREAFRLHKGEFPTGIDLIVVPRSQVLSFRQASASLPELARAAARRIGIRSPKPPG